jgi:hypothetical protein
MRGLILLSMLLDDSVVKMRQIGYASDVSILGGRSCSILHCTNRCITATD